VKERLGAEVRRLGRALRDPYQLAMLALLALGLVFRLRGVVTQPIGLWGDEASWARNLFVRDHTTWTFRPIGYMWLTKQLVEGFGSTEFWFRSLSILGGVASLLLSPYLASRLFHSRWVRLLLVAVIALHPACIDMSKEFKPYALSMLVHMVPILLYLRFEQTKRSGYLYGMLALLPVLFLLAYDFAVAYPGLLLLGLWAAWKRHGAKGGLVAVASGVACVAVIYGVWNLALTNVHGGGKATQKWAKKYGVFYTPPKNPATVGLRYSRVRWTAVSYADVASLPGDGSKLWTTPEYLEPGTVREAVGLNWLMWVVLHVLGLVHLFRTRRYALLLGLWAPVVVSGALAMLDLWPFSNWRADFYLLSYAVPIAMYGVAFAASDRPRRSVAVVGLVVALSIVPGFLFGFDGFATKRWHTTTSYPYPVIERLRTLRRQLLERNPKAAKQYVLRDWASGPIQWYLQHHDAIRKRDGAWFDDSFTYVYLKTRKPARVFRRHLERSSEPMIVISSVPKHFSRLQKNARSVGKVVFVEQYEGTHQLMVVARR
jgi:hypothetical protein